VIEISTTIVGPIGFKNFEFLTAFKIKFSFLVFLTISIVASIIATAGKMGCSGKWPSKHVRLEGTVHRALKESADRV
jgi:hypothetical protein